jgi:prevent-host-death family protein
MQTLPLSEVKARLSEIADEADQTHERVYVTRNGRDFVVLMSKEPSSCGSAVPGEHPYDLIVSPAAVRGRWLIGGLSEWVESERA